MSIPKSKKRRLLLYFVLFLFVVGFIAAFGWYKFLREEPEQKFANEVERFKYGSIGAEFDRGIPYWIWLVLPRIFPDLMPGPGGYKSFGLVWEDGQEMPVGFSKKTIGVFPRVTNNCALCHATTWREKVDSPTHIVVAGGAHTTNVQAM